MEPRYQINYNGTTTADNLLVKQQELIRLLQNHDCEVTFTKVDGTTRVMPCTLRLSALPERPLTENKERKHSTETISVWCLDKQAWRSFKIANVTNIAVV